jgi:Arylsulfotransferase (ASST)
VRTHTGNRREFLALAAGGAALAVLGRDAGSSLAAGLPVLPAYAGSELSDGVLRFRSRPDLIAPQVVIDTPSKGSLGGLVITDVNKGPSQSGPLIVNHAGRIIWFNPMAPDPTSHEAAFNVNVGTYRGKQVLSWFQGVVTGSHGVGYGLGHYQIVDTSYRPVATVSGQNGFEGDLHEFILTPEGTALFTCYGNAVANMTIGGVAHQVPYLFGVVQEVDVATGKLLFQWRTDQHVPLTDSYKSPVLQPGWVWDYFHVNSISIDPSDGNLVIAGRNVCASYKVNRRTGKVMWRLGGKHSDFHMAAGTRFFFQHDLNMHADGVMTVFDNEGGPPQRAAHSRALVLNVDERRRKVTLRHAFQHHPQVYSDALGSVQPLAGNDWFVGWGRSTSFTKYSNTGRVLFDGHLAADASSYRAFLQPWTATPKAPPDLAAAASGNAATLYASWNGSTELSGWRVLGGPATTQLTPIGTAPVIGFETAITVPQAPGYVAVQALDAKGRVLGRSAAVGARSASLRR